MPAKTILVNSFNKLNLNEAGSTAAPLYINSDRIISIATRATAYLTTGVTDIVYELNVNNSTYQITLIVTESAAVVNSKVLSSVASLGVGQTILVAGTKVIAIPGLTTSSIALVSLVSSATGSLTVTYQAVCTADTLTLRANVAAGTLNNADISTVNYAVVG